MKNILTYFVLIAITVFGLSSCAQRSGFQANEANYSGYKFEKGNYSAPVVAATVESADELTIVHEETATIAFEENAVASLNSNVIPGDKRKKPTVHTSTNESDLALAADKEAEKETVTTKSKMSRSERKELRKLARKARKDPNSEEALTLKERLKKKMDGTAEDLLLLILCLILPWLAIFIFEDGMTTNFWIDFILWLIGVSSFLYFNGLLLLISILFAIYVIFLA